METFNPPSCGLFIARALALRLKDKLTKLIDDDQTGFLQGRNISHNIRTVLDIIQYAKDKQLKMVVVSMDWEKCFDKISHVAIDRALQYFNFGPQFRAFVQTLFQDSFSCVANNGFFSNELAIRAGCKQGCNISPLLYVALSEVLTQNIRNNNKIKGIKLGDKEFKLGQFADDMNLFLQFEEETIMSLEDTLDKFTEATGLQVNYDKTCIYRIGSLARTQAKIYTRKPFTWTNEPIKILGIMINHDMGQTLFLNYEHLLSKVRTICEIWSHRNLTLMGKALIINSLCASLYVYRMSVLPLLNETYINRFVKIVTHFLWNGGKPKISRQNEKTQKN